MCELTQYHGNDGRISKKVIGALQAPSQALPLSTKSELADADRTRLVAIGWLAIRSGTPKVAADGNC